MNNEPNRSQANEPLQIFINRGYHNEATLEFDMDQDIKMCGQISWGALIKDILQCSLCDTETKDFMERYGIDKTQLAAPITEAALEEHIVRINFQHDNHTGASAKLFNLLRESRFFEPDINGNSNINGCELTQTTANGPRQSVVIRNEESADWLARELSKRNINAVISFV